MSKRFGERDVNQGSRWQRGAPRYHSGNAAERTSLVGGSGGMKGLQQLALAGTGRHGAKRELSKERSGG